MAEQLALLGGVLLGNRAERRRDMVAQERAAVVTARLCARGVVTLEEAQDLTGLTYSGVWYLMSKIARVSPCWYDKEARAWKMVEGG